MCLLGRRLLCSKGCPSLSCQCAVVLLGPSVLLLISELLVDLPSDGPDESQKLAANGRCYFLPELALGRETPIARAESVLRFPGDLLDLLTQPFLTFLESSVQSRPMLVCPGCFADNAAHVRFPVLVIAPRRTLLPGEFSLETMPL
jgi:hypothetical protein